MAKSYNRVALVAGASGLVGREILTLLLRDTRYQSVVSIGRRTLAIEHPRLVQQIVDFANLPRLPKVDDVFIALGTTLKVAGSQAAFRSVDYNAIVAVALAAHASEATNIGVISALGAAAGSRLFYNRVKGETEDALARLGFDSLVIARPSLLAGQRGALGQPTRSGERIGQVLMQALKPLMPTRYHAIEARDVAFALIESVKTDRPGTRILHSSDMQGAYCGG